MSKFQIVITCPNYRPTQNGIGRVQLTDTKRLFDRATVRRAWIRQDKVCGLCARELPFDLMQGDHIIPWSMGGQTTLENCQALCGSCNLRKGTKNQNIARAIFSAEKIKAGTAPLRTWQLSALKALEPIILKRPVLVEACPGAGKTHFGLDLIYRLLRTAAISRVLIFVPTLSIADGWLNAASSANKNSANVPLLGPRTWHPARCIPPDKVGVVSTYQALFAATDMFLAHATDPGHRTLILFDEIHHAGADAGWGQRAQQAFTKNARATVSLTGTPFRTNGDQIVFVPTNAKGMAIPDFRYGYDEAIVDEACRPVQFVFVQGSTKFRTSDDNIHTVRFADELTNSGAKMRLRTALECVTQGSIAHRMLAEANQYILQLRREGDSDAAGLVVCVDCNHADKIATFMSQNVVSNRPVVAASRTLNDADPEPADAIREFRGSYEPWIIAVNMISEGVDIRRLRVVVYLTNRIAELAFRQIVGRVVRSDHANQADHGRVYMAADPQMVKMARRITNEVRILPQPMVIETDPQTSQVAVSANGRDRGSFEALNSTEESIAAVDSNGQTVKSELIHQALRYIEEYGLTNTDPVSLALAALRKPELLNKLKEYES